jgi:hypothetical protein
MTLKNLLTIIGLIVGLISITVMLILTKRGKFKLETWPRILGIGGGVYAFVSLMIQSIFSGPPSELLDYTVTNAFLSLTLGIMAYLSMRMAVRGKRNRN